MNVLSRYVYTYLEKLWLSFVAQISFKDLVLELVKVKGFRIKSVGERS